MDERWTLFHIFKLMNIVKACLLLSTPNYSALEDETDYIKSFSRLWMVISQIFLAYI
jgi:hypothetical protein